MDTEGAATRVATRLRRTTPLHDAYTVRVANRRVAALSTAHRGDARRWIYTTRWLHRSLLRSGRLVVGLGVQWTPAYHRHQHTPPPATLQLCAGHRCLVFHLAQADAVPVPAALYHFLADPRVLFVGSGSAYDRRMLLEHYGIKVACGRELRAVAGMGNASLERMAERFLGYPGIAKPRRVAMGAWHALRLSAEQVEYACVDAYLAFRLGVILCSADHQPLHRAPPPARRAPVLAPPPVPRVPVRAPPPAPRATVLPPAPPAPPIEVSPRALVEVAPRAPPPAPPVEVSPRALVEVAPRAPPPTPRVEVSPRALHPSPRAPLVLHCPLPPGPRVAVLPDSTGSDTDTEHGSETSGNLPVARRSSYATDDDDEGFSDEFELVGYGSAATDEEDGIGIEEYIARTGLLSDGDYVVMPDGYEEEEDGCEGYKEYTGIGILSADDSHIEAGYKEYTGILAVGDGAPPEDDFVAGEAGYYEVDNGYGPCDGW